LWTGVILDETRTREAIVDSFSQGLLLFDAEDRLVLRNSYYLQLYPESRDIAVPGASYEEVARNELLHTKPDENRGIQEGLVERLQGHGTNHHVSEMQLQDGRWILVNEKRTQDGGTVVIFTEGSGLKGG